jgi:hypothetical protein
MRRSITIFDSENDRLVAEYPLHNIETDVPRHGPNHYMWVIRPLEHTACVAR